MLLEVANEAGIRSSGREEHGLKVGQGGVFDEWIFDRKFVGPGGGVERRGGGGRRRWGIREEVFETSVGLERGHLDVGGFEFVGREERVVGREE